MAVLRQKLAYATLAVSLSALAAAAYYLYFLIVTPLNPLDGQRLYEVREGAPLTKILDGLKQQGFIRNARVLKLYALYKGYSGSIKAGLYSLSGSMSPFSILEMLRRGEVTLQTVTIPEGFNIRQIADTLAREGVVEREDFLARAYDPSLPRQYGIEAGSLEGFLFPDTYRFARRSSGSTVINAMVSRFMEMTEPLRKAPLPAGLSFEDVVILASIVEKETANPSERPLIAGVFINRMKRGMPLASDPTVIYGLEAFDGNLRRADLERPSPYNTYILKGLPAGPICNPGIASIRAVLEPADTDYLYFVSRNDGTHLFSRTYDEHRRAVRLYQPRKNDQEKKTP